MSTDTSGSGDTPDLEVPDDEEFVDRAVKKRILNARERVNKSEETIYVGTITEPDLNLSPSKQLRAWSQVVRQYLRDIEVLMKKMPTEQAEGYYKNVGLGEVTLVPPDKAGYEFSKVAIEDLGDEVLKQEIGLPKRAELPKPHTERFEGLRSLIETDYISHRWVVTIDDSGPPAERETVMLETRRAIPKWIYENAIRVSDQFLHDIGMGVEIQAEPYMGDDGPGL